MEQKFYQLFIPYFPQDINNTKLLLYKYFLPDINQPVLNYQQSENKLLTRG